MTLFIFYIIIGFVFWIGSSVYAVIIAKEHNKEYIDKPIAPSYVLITIFILFMLIVVWVLIFLWSMFIYGIGKIIGNEPKPNFKDILLETMIMD